MTRPGHDEKKVPFTMSMPDEYDDEDEDDSPDDWRDYADDEDWCGEAES